MRVILSCTTTFHRQKIFYYVYQSLCKQNLEPDLFLINLSKNAYLNDKGFASIPKWLSNPEKEYVKINWVENTGPYRKLLPAVKEANGNDIIITVDDDILYDNSFLKDLVQCYKKHPNSIVCARARKMEKNIFNNWKNYSYWTLIKESTKGQMLLPTGGGGVVYNKKLLNLECLLDDNFLKIAPTTDDLWYRMASLKEGVPVSVFPEIDYPSMYVEHTQGLMEINFNTYQGNSLLRKGGQVLLRELTGYFGISQTPNDKAWEAICDYCSYK